MRLTVKLLINTFFVSAVILSCSENTGNNLVDSVDETAVLYGYIYLSDGIAVSALENISVHIYDEGFDKVIKTDHAGKYIIPDVPNGNYTISPSKDGYHFVPRSRDILINGNDRWVHEFFCLKENDMTIRLYININDTDTIAVSGVNLHLSGNGGDVSKTTNVYGTCTFTVSMDSTYNLIPEMNEEGYTFEPESMNIEPDEYSDYYTHCEFTLLYSGPPLNSISGKISNFDILDMNFHDIELEHNGNTLLILQPDMNGNYLFNRLKDDTYTVNFSYGGEDYTFTPKSFTVTINGEDVVLPDVTRRYIGPTSYTITGRVTDEEHNGIPEVTITILVGTIFHKLITDAEGYYSKEFLVGEHPYKVDSVNFSFKPKKDNLYFTPADTTFTLFRQDDISDGGEITVPDFIGYTYQRLDAPDFFPVTTESSWTYERTEVDAEPYDFTVTVTGTVKHDGKIFRRMSEPGPWKFTDYRIEDNNVFAFSDNEEVLFLDFSGETGKEWEMGTIAGTYIRTGTFMGTETLETPAGTFENCAHFESKVMYGEISYDSYDLWYAPGVGLVKSVKIVENYGQRLEYVIDELKAYEVP